MKNLKSEIGMIYYLVKNARRSLKICKKNNYYYMLIKLSHRLEKGMTQTQPKEMWGWEKAEQIIGLLELYNSRTNDLFALKISVSVLNAFLHAKENSQYESDINRSKDFMIKHMKIINKFSEDVNDEMGGVIRISKKDVLLSKDDIKIVKKVLNDRHSTRMFSNEDVSNDTIIEAVNMAIKSPSACNRQTNNVYIIDSKIKKQCGELNNCFGNKYLILTGKISGYETNELNDWIVSSSIFAGYLSISLHALGIGNCIIRKDIIHNSSYNDNMKRICKIPDDEQIILEIAIGNYDTNFLVPISYRKHAKDIVHFVESSIND